MPATPGEVGQKYDLLLRTRDGATLPCRNKDGQTVNVSQVAYCTSVDRNAQGQHEETELQHKDHLVQLGSPNLIDREFTQWPQVSQGDWSGGTLQRVFTGATPISGGVASDPSRYWDGLGIIWPIADYLPQQSLLADPDRGETGNAIMRMAGNGPTGGNIDGSSAFVYLYMANAAPQHNKIHIQFSGSTSFTIDPIPGSTNGAIFTGCDYIISQRRLWFMGENAGNVVVTAYDGAGTSHDSFTVATATLNGNADQGRIAIGQVGSKTYMAMTYITGGGVVTLRVIDITTPGTFNSFEEVQLVGGTGFGDVRTVYYQLEFFGSAIVLAGGLGSGPGSDGFLIAFDINSQTFTTIATFPGIGDLYFVPIAGGLFILASNNVNTLSTAASVDMYLLQGGALQHIGPIYPQGTVVGGQNTIAGLSEPVAFGPYAIFPIYYVPPGSGCRVAIFAYDVLRGRMFKLHDIGPYGPFLGPTSFHGRRMALIPPMSHPFSGDTIAAQWAVAPGTLSVSGSLADTVNVQRLVHGVSKAAFQPFLQQGVQITSSIIDFTSAQTKLFRQVEVAWSQPGLPNDPGITVQLDAWLDQDPAGLSPQPDFTTGVVSAGSGGLIGQTKLSLLINEIATKIVYRVTTTGPSINKNSAVKLVSVIVRAATGWVQTMKLDLAPNVIVNSKNGNVWDQQSIPGQPSIDHVVGYSFLRQLWRLRGGQMHATFPNGDDGNWLIQDIHFDSPKPMAVSFRSDQQTTYQTIATVKMAEDI